MYWEGLYAIPLLATAMTCGLAVFLAREVPFAGRTALIVVLLGAAEWSLGSFFEISVEHLNVKIFWDNLQFLGYSSVVPGIVIFVLTYRRQSFRLPRWLVGGLFVEPVATNVLAWTNNLHGLIRIRPVIEE